MSWGTLTVGRLTLKETYTLTDAVNASSGDRSIALTGVETSPPHTVAELVALGEDLGTLLRQVLPITFSQKSERNGYYEVQDVNVTALTWPGEASALTWTLSLNFLGPDNAVDVESRLASVVRANDFALSGERWHAPSIGHYSYQAGTAVPATVVRTGETGAVTVYRAIPTAINPRWGCPVGSYLGGGVRVLQGGLDRAGAGITLTSGGWELNNGLVRIRPNTNGAINTTLQVAVWNGSAWSGDKSWDVRFAGTTVNVAQMRSAVVLRNNPEMSSIRIMCQSSTSSARRIIDVSLRRGSRFLEGYAQQSTSGAITITPDVTEVFVDTSAQGYLTATADDNGGIKYVIGSSKTFTADSAGGINKNAVLGLDFFIGALTGGVSLGITDGDFETGVAGWTATGGTFTQANDQFKVGAWSGKMVTTGTPTQTFVRPAAVTVVPGNRYKVSFWARSLGGRTVGCTIDWQISGAYQSTDASNTVLAAGVWTWLEFEAVCPAAPVGINEAVYGPNIGSSPTAGETLWVDRVRFRPAVDPGDVATVLRDQYIGAMSEVSRMVQR